MKKWLAGILALCMIASCAACSGGETAAAEDAEYSSVITVSDDAALEADSADAAEAGTETEISDAAEAVQPAEAETEPADDAAEDVVSDSESKDYIGTYVCEAVGDGITIHSDGTFVAWKDYEDRTGKAIGTYYQDGDAWVFVSAGLENGSQTGTFDGKDWTFGGDVYEHTLDMSLDITMSPMHGIYVKGDSVAVITGKVGALEDKGFTIESDNLDETVAPGETAEVTVSYKKAEATVWAVNTYEKDAPVSECRVYAFYTEDTSGKFQLDSDGHECGQDNFDDLLNFQVYDYRADRLVYKTWVSTPIVSSFTVGENLYGEEIMEVSGHVTLTMDFDGSVLHSFRYESDGIANQGMDDNMDADAAAAADDSAIKAAEIVRDDICTQLIEAFADSDIDLSIDEKTGEITMDNNILFDTDSYELSEAGMAYLDEFVGTYAQVLLSDEFRGSVAQIRFEGHTDSSGDFGYNQTLSQKRAEAVLDYCLSSTGNGLTDEQKQQLSDLAKAQGYSCTDLVYDENGQEDADASRRVAIRFLVDVG